MSLTDQDKQWIREQLAEQLEKKLEEKLEEKLAGMASKQDLERVETNLLTAFHQWASPLEMRLRTHSAALRAIDAEIEYHEDRIKKLEGEKPAM